MTNRWRNIIRRADGSVYESLYRLGFAWEDEYELEKEHGLATWDIPSWANSPSAGIIGTWRLVRRRTLLRGVPITRWHEVQA